MKINDIKIKDLEKSNFKSVGSALAFFRKSAGLTQSEVAEKLGLKTQSSVGDIEARKDRIPEKNTIKKYCEAIGLDEEKINFLYEVRKFCVRKKNNKEIEKHLVHENVLSVEFTLVDDCLIKKNSSEVVSVGSCKYPSGSFLVYVSTNVYAPYVRSNGFLVLNPTKKTVSERSSYYLATLNNKTEVVKIRRDKELYIVERFEKDTQIFTEDNINEIVVFGYIEDYLYRGKISF